MKKLYILTIFLIFILCINIYSNLFQNQTPPIKVLAGNFVQLPKPAPSNQIDSNDTEVASLPAPIEDLFHMSGGYNVLPCSEKGELTFSNVFNTEISSIFGITTRYYGQNKIENKELQLEEDKKRLKIIYSIEINQLLIDLQSYLPYQDEIYHCSIYKNKVSTLLKKEQVDLWINNLKSDDEGIYLMTLQQIDDFIKMWLVNTTSDKSDWDYFVNYDTLPNAYTKSMALVDKFYDSNYKDDVSSEEPTPININLVIEN